MKRSLAVLSAILISGVASPQIATAQLALRIELPSSTPPNARIFLAGDFNRWSPGDSAFALKIGADGAHSPWWTPKSGHQWTPETRPPRVAN